MTPTGYWIMFAVGVVGFIAGRFWPSSKQDRDTKGRFTKEG